MASIFRSGLFEGQVAVVTGGGSGIGLATARVLGELGAKVAICGRSADKLAAGEARLREAGVREVFATTCDIREPDQVTAFAAGVKEKLGTASILVNNTNKQFPTTTNTLSPTPSRRTWTR